MRGQPPSVARYTCGMFRRRDMVLREIFEHIDTPSTRPARRHGRRSIRSSPAGALLVNPNHPVLKFRNWSASVLDYLRMRLGSEIDGIDIGFITSPIRKIPTTRHTHQTPTYELDRQQRTIIMYRAPIQRFRGLHVHDEDHRRMYVEHCIYTAICDYLEVAPWELLPGEFEHF